MSELIQMSDGGIARLGDHVSLSDDAEIDAAYAARQAIEGLDDDAKCRVLTWVASAFDLTTRVPA